METTVPRIHLEQWRALVAVVDAGGYAAAALRLHKSQSAVTYAVQKIERLLGIKAFELQGRKSVLTTTGKMLYRRAVTLLGEAGDLERAARKLSAGWEPEIALAVEILFPACLLLDCLAEFGAESPDTRVEIVESVISGTSEALTTGAVDMAITPRVPPGFLGTPLTRLRLIAVASSTHPLHQLNRPLVLSDLSRHRHLPVRESGTVRNRKTSVEVEQRWTFGTLASSMEAACEGHGFAWYPEEAIRNQLLSGRLLPLPLQGAEERFVELSLVLADPEFAGPGVLRLAALIRARVERCGPVIAPSTPPAAPAEIPSPSQTVAACAR